MRFRKRAEIQVDAIADIGNVKRGNAEIQDDRNLTNDDECVRKGVAGMRGKRVDVCRARASARVRVGSTKANYYANANQRRTRGRGTRKGNNDYFRSDRALPAKE